MGDLEKKRSKEEEVAATDRGEEQKLPYPKSVFFIVGNEFCERFSYYGMKAILSIYLKKKLHFTEDKATVIYHTFSMFCYFTPIFGAMIADQLLGKFKTIVYISIIYVLGHLLKTLAAIPTLGIPPVEFSLIGLALIAIGTGGIKPCVSAFGGDQFKLPEQARQLQTFFSIFYFSINAGSLISTVLTPAIREDVECFGDDTCYSLAFGIPAILMLVATVIIIMGKPLYKMKPPQGNILTRVFGSIGYAVKKKIDGVPADHWMDLAKDRYEPQLVEDVKCVLRVLVLYLPLPVWWALFDQTGSRWTFQATRMNGVVGDAGTIKPDQMQVINPLLILFLLPLFDKVLYPAFAKFNMLQKPLQRMTAGGILTAASFFISGFLELEMMKTYAKIPAVGFSEIHFMNNIPCHVSLQLSNGTGLVQEEAIDKLENMVLRNLEPGKYSLDMEVSSTCLPAILTKRTEQVEVMTHDKEVTAVFLGVDGGAVLPTVLDGHDDPEKDDGANGRIKVVYDMGKLEKSTNLTLKSDKSYSFDLQPNGVYGSNYSKIDTGLYDIMMDDAKLGNITIDQGGVYSLIVARDPETNIHRSLTHTLTTPNSIHILWLFPQYFVITVGEIMFSVTGLEFSYSQAPESMKSVLQAAWLLTVAFGNIIVIIVAEAKAFNDQASEFFMFACLMLVDMGIFMWLAWRYTPRFVGSRDIPMKNGVANTNFKNDTEM
eukprot:GFUD01044142.1.p1 GENE.GFUD01044142.1~~GFUD01044142.1.p1  ORF type:complete len:713 (-),score=206.77 GFUD01044142.1:312-2450(-)